MVLALEIRRKSFHAILGILVVIALHFLGNRIIFFSSVIFFAINVLFRDRIMRSKRVPFVSEMLDIFERKKFRKTNPGKGAFFYCVAVIFLTALFPRQVCEISLLILAVSDALSTIIGMKYGSIKLKENKSLEGSLAFYLSALFILLRYNSPLDAVIIAFSATFMEFQSWVDDNFSVPVGTAVVMTIMRWISI